MKIRKKLTVLLLLLSVNLLVTAQAIVIKSTNGTSSTIPLNTVESIVFSNNTLIFNNATCQTNYFSIFLTSDLTFDQTNSVGGYSSGNKLFMVYPNPVNDLLTIENIGGQEHHLRVFNVFGEEILNFEMTTSLITINVNDLPAGVYFLSTEDQCVKFLKK